MENNFGEQTLESMNQASWYNAWTLNKFKIFLKGKILEVGCGIGNFTKILSSYGEISAIDIHKQYLPQVRKKTPDAQVGLGNIEEGKYFFKNKKFNSIVCINVLEHIENDEAALNNMSKLLLDGGILILLVPSYPFLYGEIDKAISHFRRYAKKDLITKIEAEDFKIIEFKKLNFIGAIGWFVSGRILKNKIVDSSKIKIFNLIAPLFLKFEDFIPIPFGTSFLIIAKKNK